MDVAGEDADTVRRFLATTSVGFPHPRPGRAVMGRWKATALPTTIVVDRRGRTPG